VGAMGESALLDVGLPLLRVEGLCAGYGAVSVLHEVDLRIDPGQLVALIGSNGAGKSTLLRSILGVCRPTGGTVHFDGAEITRRRPGAVTRAGLAMVPENRRVFPRLTVSDNLALGGWVRRGNKRHLAETVDRILEDFPVLAERRGQMAGTLSGGEQQMLAIGMALMARPKLLLLDEPSLGLAPIVVDRVFERIAALKTGGMAILLVEQLAERAIELADRVAAMRLGRIEFEGVPESISSDDRLVRSYLGA
jgi:branched-chain amino acid transport system ATP-binding protein